ncbi:MULTISPECIES: RHS repeat domain-containing protein [Cysteiniphilum]|uniref:RHS repeat domain-containing protein n=1 Tax=Cysteiniphilum TaxID=2056696 RepID=UPI00177EC08B|nr:MULTISPECIES: RHS repeat-associated core domain-containing protein [Cysteiniphilum]
MKGVIYLLSVVLSITNGVAAQYHYDANGNMTEDNIGNLYIYSANNKLVGVQNFNHKLNDNNHYNAAGFRDARNIDGHTVGLIYKDGQLINELSNQVKSSYLKHDVRYLEAESENHQYRMLANNNSTSLLLADNADIENSYNYNAYGSSARYADNSPKVSGINANLIAYNPLTYDGEYQDHDIGLIYLRARFYNPKLMRFMQRDSYNLLNRYAFANSDPVNHIDPSGHSSVVGSFFQGLGDGLLSGATIGFCCHYGCSVDSYYQLLTGDLSSFGELFNPITAMVPLIQHGGNSAAWANAVGMSMPNMVITMRDAIATYYAYRLNRLMDESNKNVKGAISSKRQINPDILALKSLGKNVASRRNGLNYFINPILDIRHQFDNDYISIFQDFKKNGPPKANIYPVRLERWENDIVNKLYKNKSDKSSVQRYITYSDILLLYSINTNNSNQYNVINNH